MNTINVFKNFAELSTEVAKPTLRLSNHTTPRGTPICDSEHYTAFELADEKSEGGFTAVVHAKRGNGNHSNNVTRYCFVRSVVADQLQTLENARKGR